MPRYYIFFDPTRKAVRTGCKKPQHYPHIYIWDNGVTIYFSKNIKVTCKNLEEAQYFLLAHELQATDEHRQQAFRSLRERLEAMKTLREVRQRG